VLAVALEPTGLDHPATWRLLDAEVSDAMRWSDAAATADDVAVRLRRWWWHVEALLDSRAVTGRLVGRAARGERRRSRRGV
jgi:hypothetical protein